MCALHGGLPCDVTNIVHFCDKSKTRTLICDIDVTGGLFELRFINQNTKINNCKIPSLFVFIKFKKYLFKV